MKVFKEKISTIIEGIDQDDIFTRAAALAYYTALAMAPLLILVVWFLSTLELDLQQQFVSQVQGFVGDEAAKLMATIMSSGNERPDLTRASGWIGLGGILISASIIFAQLQASLNLIFNVDEIAKPKLSKFGAVKDIVMRRIFSVGMLMTFVFIAVVSLLVSSAITYFFGQSDLAWFEVVNSLVSFSIFTILFTIIYKWMPDRSLDTPSSLAGGAITALLFVIGKYLISLYIGKAAVGSAYGAAGSLVVLLVWVYYSSLIVFIGAEVSYALFKKNLEEPEPEKAKTKAKSPSQLYVGGVNASQ